MFGIRSFLFLCIGAAGALALGALAAPPSPAPLQAPAGLEVTNPRICAAVTVYRLANSDDWSPRATIASTTINGYREAGQVQDCAGEVTQALTSGFMPPRWQAALDAVDAVMVGDYTLSPLACARANTIVRVGAALPVGGRSPRTDCVINGLAFVEVHR